MILAVVCDNCGMLITLNEAKEVDGKARCEDCYKEAKETN